MRGDDLLEAAKAGDRTRVQELTDADPALAAYRASSGETPLMAALYRGHQAIVEDLADVLDRARAPLDVFAAAATGRQAALETALAGGPVVNSVAYDGWTPLHLAAFFGRRAAAARLLAAGADVAAVSRNSLANTPLHAALAGGHTEVALLLVEHGAPVGAADSGGHTPLHIAAENGSEEAVKALLAHGADPHAVDQEDKTPLSRAAARNRTAIVDIINLRGSPGDQKVGR